MTTANILKVAIFILALICSLAQTAPTTNREDQDDKRELVDQLESNGSRHKRSPFRSTFVTLRIDHHRYLNETSVRPAPFSNNSINYSKYDCGRADFSHEIQRRSHSKQASNCRNGWEAFKCDCDKGYFPPMCDYNKTRLPQKISMVDCGRCHVHGEGRVKFPRCMTAKKTKGYWTAQHMEIDLPFRHNTNSSLYVLKSQIITVGCVCKEFKK
jgi:hypothetical protein